MDDYKMRIFEDIRKQIKDIYSINYPKHEMYGLQSQIRRAMVSVSLNIVEGNARCTSKDYRNFCYNARASLEEVNECLRISKDLGYITDINKFMEVNDSIGRQISSLINYLSSKIQNP